MVSSELPEIIGMSDNILVMYEGKIKGKYNSKNATQEKVMHACLLDDMDTIKNE